MALNYDEFVLRSNVDQDPKNHGHHGPIELFLCSKLLEHFRNNFKVVDANLNCSGLIPGQFDHSVVIVWIGELVFMRTRSTKVLANLNGSTIEFVLYIESDLHCGRFEVDLVDPDATGKIDELLPEMVKRAIRHTIALRAAERKSNA